MCICAIDVICRFRVIGWLFRTLRVIKLGLIPSYSQFSFLLSLYGAFSRKMEYLRCLHCDTGCYPFFISIYILGGFGFVEN